MQENIFKWFVCDLYILYIYIVVLGLIKWSILLKARIYLKFSEILAQFQRVKGEFPASRVTIYPLENFR